MMNIGDAEARAMSMHDYEMRMWHWQEAHTREDDKITDPKITEKLIEDLRNHPQFLKRTKGEKPPTMPARLSNA